MSFCKRDSMNTGQQQQSPLPAPSTRWLPLEEVVPGMVLAHAVVSTHNRVMDFMVSEGTALSEGILAQLIARGIECVAINDPNPLSPADCHALQAAYVQRLQMIFGAEQAAQMPADTRDLFEAVLAAGPQR